ncbi:MAG: Fic family protein [Acidimicrobiia bacterium]|nr:Fic family protein [Acidimicrobiia bacterium]
MARTVSTPWPTEARTVFFDNVASRDTLGRAVASGRIRRLAPRLYSADLLSDPDELVVTNRWQIVGRILPGAVITDRSAAQNGSVTEGALFVASQGTRKVVRLPGMEIRIRPGGPLGEPFEDLPWPSGLRMSSPARTLVDNLAISRGRGGRISRTLSLEELEDWLARKAIVWGPERTARLRGEAIALADATGAAERVERLNRLFEQLAGRVPPRPGAGRLLQAFAAGRAWDDGRVEMFNRLARGLAEYQDPDVPDWLPAGPEAEGLPFFESYFSNYIEGTVFSVAEARRIIDTQRLPASRPADGHDILGTYRCVADIVGRRATYTDPEELLDHLCERHRMIMAGRPEMGPGQWKKAPNQVGAYLFVDPELAEGTLRRGFELAASVPAGFRRAMYVMVVVAEVHPFTDGNGRVARVMMNAELSASDAARIVIPSVYRNEYVAGLRRTSLAGGADVSALVRVMGFAWRWTAAMPWEDPAATEGQLEATNALHDPDDAQLGGVRLELP